MTRRERTAVAVYHRRHLHVVVYRAMARLFHIRHTIWQANMETKHRGREVHA